MQIPKGKLAAAGLGVVTAVSSPTNYDLRFNMGTSTGPQAFQAREQGSAGEPFVITEALVDAKLEAVEARTETKFAQLFGKLDLVVQGLGDLKGEVGALSGKIDTVDGHARTGKREIIVAIVTTGLAAAALAWAGVQIFQGGLSLSQGAFQAGMAAQQGKTNDQSQASAGSRGSQPVPKGT